ncbi:MAG: gluconate 2-dehydrogenase subunit 3 family protein, partial [Thermomicrobiales bacterium]
MPQSGQTESAPTVAGPQSPAAATPVTPAAAPVGVLTEEQRALLAAALNRIVPAQGDLPGAGELGVGEQIGATLAVAPALRRRFLDGLAAIAIAGDRPFTELDGAAQDAALRAVEEAQPGFFSALVEHTYRHYYTLPAVHRAIGHESRPPQPEGYQLPPFDPALLTVQRRRAPFWRQVQ